MSLVVPFPASRRIRQVKKTANFMATSTTAVAESHLRHQLFRLVQRLERAGVARELIDAEKVGYEAAVRAELWRQVLTPGGAA